MVADISGMVERLILTLRALAASAGDPERSPAGEPILSRLAPDYADAVLLVTDCPQIELGAVQRAALERVGEALERLDGARGGTWITATEREHVRALARQALRTLGESSDRSA
jgi:hypothetical protein